MAHRAESNNTDKLPWTSPGSFKNNKTEMVTGRFVPNYSLKTVKIENEIVNYQLDINKIN